MSTTSMDVLPCLALANRWQQSTVQLAVPATAVPSSRCT